MSDKEFKYGRILCYLIIALGILMLFCLENFKIISLFIVLMGLGLLISGESTYKKEYAKKMDGWVKTNNNMWINKNKQRIEFNQKQFDFKDILASELIENENTISITERKQETKEKSTTQKHVAPVKGIVGATIGGVLGGPIGATAGAIIGGTSGKANTKSKEKTEGSETTKAYDVCNSLMIKVSINSITNPCEFIKFISSPMKKSSIFYSAIKEAAEKQQATFERIIKQNNNLEENKMAEMEN